MASTQTIQRDGRTWSVDSNGINNLKRRYSIVLATNNLGANGEIESLDTYGIPAIGSAHPTYKGLVVQSYDVEEGEESEKKVLHITVNYGLNSDGTSDNPDDDEQEAIEEWGWDSATAQKEVTTNLMDSAQESQASGVVLNSAGDPFESLPTVDYPSPVFTKVVKTTTRKDWMSINCKTNKNSITIGSMSCAPKTLLASIGESRIIGDNTSWKYRYTINLHYQSNMQMFGSGTSPIEYGWDIALIDCGMRQKNSKGELEVIMRVDGESKMPTAVTSPELLNGAGKAVERKQGETVKPYVIRVQAYETATYPNEIYSEPTA